MKVASHSSAMPDREEVKRFCPLHRFLGSASDLARNDNVVSGLLRSSENVIPTEGAKRPSGGLDSARFARPGKAVSRAATQKPKLSDLFFCPLIMQFSCLKCLTVSKVVDET